MLEDRLSLLKAEIDYLDIEKKQFPELFVAPNGVEDAELLKRVGIIFPNKNQEYLFYLKSLSTDFIVEEIAKDGEVFSIEYADLELDADAGIDSTIYTTLVKSNIQTLDAISDIAKSLGIEVNKIGYAGIKDKHGVTAQRISIRGSNFENIKKIQSPFFF
jgi:TruD family tRNA pseudouridine synthase